MDRSIVALHGIGAHPDDTWCKPVKSKESGERYVNWLKDPEMLPAEVPKVRIMRFGYKSQWFGPNAIGQKTSAAANTLILALTRIREVCALRLILLDLPSLINTLI